MMTATKIRRPLAGLLTATAAAICAIGHVQAASAATVTRTSTLPIASKAGPQRLDFSPDGRLVASVNQADSTVTVLGVSTGGALSKVSGGTRAAGTDALPSGIDFSPSGGLLAVALQREAKVLTYRVAANGTLSSPVATPSGSFGPAVVAFSPGGGLLAVGTNARYVRMFRVASDGKLTAITGGTTTRLDDQISHFPEALTFTPDGRFLQVIVDNCFCVRTFAVGSGGALTPAVSPKLTAGAMAYNPAGTLIAVADTFRSRFTIFAAGAAGAFGAPLGTGTSLGAGQTAFSPGGRYVASTSVSGRLIVRDVARDGTVTSGAVIQPQLGRTRGAGLAFSPDGQTLAVGNFKPLPDDQAQASAIVTFRVGPRDTVVPPGEVGIRYGVAEFRAGQVATGVACTTAAKCTWSMNLPPGLSLADTPAGGATIRIIGTPRQAGTYKVTGRLLQGTTVRKTFSFTIVIVGSAAGGTGGKGGAGGLVIGSGGSGGGGGVGTGEGGSGGSSGTGVPVPPDPPPAPTVTLTTPANGARYALGADVRAAFACAVPGGGGLLKPGAEGCAGTVPAGAAIDTATAGTKTFTVTASTTLATAATVTHSYVVVPPPTVTITTPLVGARYTRGEVVTADYDCFAAASGRLATNGGCVGTVADGARVDTSTVGSHTLRVTATDDLGQTTTLNRTYTVVGAPSATLTTPPSGAIYPLGATVTADYDCFAGTAGTLISCTGTVPDGAAVNTATPGTRSFTVTATDDLGQTARVTRSYTVVGPPTVSIAQPDVDDSPYSQTFGTDPPTPVQFSCTTGVVQVTCAASATKTRLDEITGIPMTGFPPQTVMLGDDLAADEGRFLLTVTAVDSFGQAATPVSVDYTVVGTA
ncbi:hypothetical protein DSM112329_01808 [Paraconexibacter sp. AEG42_29]|uniref:Uncharacterized protein n=1 Tax=Paraconexibacter sp. AEG42_29 TaxID=2997339 RepID=A0AAU7ATK2_9ACTN